VDEGLEVVDEGLAAVAASDERYFESELHRLRGELLMRLPDNGAAAEAFSRAFEIATGQGAKPLAFRAATSAERLSTAARGSTR
jgi:predicted negative regulator of RcsB-dependent stress response